MRPALHRPSAKTGVVERRRYRLFASITDGVETIVITPMVLEKQIKPFAGQLLQN
jgi:hypothetical protein